jgi:hypothetical protein
VEIVFARVAGIDVHKRQVTVAVRVSDDQSGGGESRVQLVRRFPTFYGALREMAEWQEHLSSLAPGPAALQIGGDRPTHIRRQRQPVGSSALAAHHQFACPPVDVIEPQPGHLAGPQPQPQHRGDHRVVASARPPNDDHSKQATRWHPAW